MTIREQIDKQTGHYKRDKKITTVMFLLGTVGMIFIVESESRLSFGAPKPTWMLILLGVIAVLYGLGFFGTIVFSLLLRFIAKCPICDRRFRTLHKDWAFCPFCGTDFVQALEERR